MVYLPIQYNSFPYWSIDWPTPVYNVDAPFFFGVESAYLQELDW